MTKLRLQDIKVVPHPRGNRVDVQWLNPEPHLMEGVRVMRRETTHPVSHDDGKLVAEKEYAKRFDAPLSFRDDLDNSALSSQLSDHFADNQALLSPQAAVSVTEPGNRWLISDEEQRFLIIKNAEVLDVYLFGISSAEDTGLRAEVVYYYAFFPYKKEPTAPSGRVYIYDRSHRASVMATGSYDFAGQMHRMLPIIYHRYDTALPLEKVSEQDMKRGQLRRFLDLPGFQLDQLYSFATAALNFHDIHRVDEKLLTLLAQWIGWDTDHTLEIAAQRNELRNAPAMYQTIGTIPNIEAAVVKCISGWDTRTKEFVYNIFLSNRPEQLNLWLCRQNKDGKWEEPNDVFSLDFAYEGRPASVEDSTGFLWLFYHTLRDGKWDIWYKIFQKDSREWTPSQPLTGSGSIDKHPSAALQGNTLWVAWDSFNPEKQTWEIKYRGWSAGQWTGISTFDDENPGTRIQRKSPQLVVDSSDRLWSFWLEKEGYAAPWQLKYNRYDGEELAISPSPGFPADEGKEPQVEKDLFVLYCRKDDSIWVFWARKRYIGDDGQRYWQIAFRKKSGIESIEAGWGPIQTLDKEILPGYAGYDDCEPAAVIYEQGGNEYFDLFWASNRGGSWAIWNIKLDNGAPIDADAAVMLIYSPYSQRTPLPLPMDEGISLLYRSNRCISYESDVYGATVITDFRYAGCTTIDPRNEIKNGLGRWQKYGDFLTYTYDTGKNGKPTDDDWYARDTIGLYLTPDTDDQKLIMKNRELVKGVLKRFLPIQTRPIFIIEPPIYKEYVYTDDFPIKEQFADTHTTGVIEEYPGVSEDSRDRVPGWICIHSWSLEFPAHHTVNLNVTPVDTNFRTLHLGLRQFAGQHNIGFPPEEYTGSSDKYEDNVPEWTWFRSVKVEYIDGQEHVEYTDHRTVNVDAPPIDTGFRTWHIGVKK